MKVYHGDLTIWSIAGGSQLDYAPDVEFVVDADTDDGSSMTSGGERQEVTKKGGRFRTGLFSSVSASRVSNLDLSAFSIDSVDYIDHVRSGRFSFSVPNQETSSVGSLWKAPQPLPNRRAVSISVELQVPAASATANALRIMGAIVAATDREDHIAATTITINSVSFTAPMTVKSVTFRTQRGDMLMVSVELVSRAPISGTFISSPSGTTSLIEKAINQSDTAIAYSFQPHDAAGFGAGFTGNMVVESFDFSIDDGRIVTTQFNYLTTGAITATNT